jgi:hypothetical protein
MRRSYTHRHGPWLAAAAARPGGRGVKKDVDRTLFDRTLAPTPEQRIRQLQAFVRFQFDLRRAGETAGPERQPWAAVTSIPSVTTVPKETR